MTRPTDQGSAAAPGPERPCVFCRIVEDGKVRCGAEHLPTPDRDELDRQAKLIAGESG